MTTATSIVRIIDTARLHLPSALEGTIRLELFNVVKEFIQRTNAWQEEVQFVVSPGVYEYPLATNQNGAFINRMIWIEGPRSNPLVPDSGIPQTAYILTPGVGVVTLRVPHPPGASETWYAHVGLSIADPTNEVGLSYAPDWITDKYHETLLDGLLSRMMLQPAKPYSNAKLSAVHGHRFQNGVGLARSEILHGFTFRGNNWQFPQTFRTGRKH